MSALLLFLKKEVTGCCQQIPRPWPWPGGRESSWVRIQPEQELHNCKMVWVEAASQCLWSAPGGAILPSVGGIERFYPPRKGLAELLRPEWLPKSRDGKNGVRRATEQTEHMSFGRGDSTAREPGNAPSSSLSPGLLGALPIDLTSAEGRQQACPWMWPFLGGEQGGVRRRRWIWRANHGHLKPN